MLDLLDYRRRMTEFYRAMRVGEGDVGACADFRQAKDELFRTHPQSALDATQKAAFNGLHYYRLYRN